MQIHQINSEKSKILVLPTALVNLYVDGKHIGAFRALCDTGSHVNLVSHRIARYFYERAEQVNAIVNGISNESIRVQRKITLEVRPWFDSNQPISFSGEFLILPKSCDWEPVLPHQDISYKEMNYQLRPILADPMFWKAEPVQMILGIEFWAQFMYERTHLLSERLLCHETKFGNLILGQTDIDCEKGVNEAVCVAQGVDTEELHEFFKRFWTFEDLSLCTKKDAECELAEKIFQDEHSRDEDGRFIVAIPLKPNINNLGSSRAIALRRFFMLEQRFNREPEFKKKYIEFMRDYEDKGHMELVDGKPDQDKGILIYHIPHHGIFTSEKFRVVYDGSCKTDQGISLNEAQLVGEKIQRDLHETVMRFRRHKVAMSADIKQMFRQLKVIQEQWNLQRIFWRENSNEPLQEYRLKVVTYGLASSPHCAVRALTEIANIIETESPELAKIIKNDFYMDDLLTGADNIEQAIELSKELTKVLDKFGFPLCKWKSNKGEVIAALKSENESSVVINEQEKTSVLGLKWLLNSDQFTYEVKCDEIAGKLTKRKILSKIGQLYDPNGFISPVIVRAKLLMQKLWQSKLDWDESVGKELRNEWVSIWENIKCLEKIRIPRWISAISLEKIQLHGFCDASIKAYGAAIYVRLIHEDGTIRTNLLVSKSRVAPLKKVTIPRLELAAAELLSNLYAVVSRAMEWQSVSYYLWSDSTIALQWLNKNPMELKLFVANRVKKICETTKKGRWFHIRTADNPADLVSRGIAANDIVNNNLWWHGPQWLAQPEKNWPKPLDWKSIKPSADVDLELKVYTMSVLKGDLCISRDGSKERIKLLDYSNNLRKIVQIVSYIVRFVSNCKNKSRTMGSRINTRSKTQDRISFPTREEQSRALTCLLRVEQRKQYSKEYKYLLERTNEPETKKDLPESSKLISLRPFLDKDRLIRVGGRISSAECPYDMKHPIIVPPGSRICELILIDAHMFTLHGAVQVMMRYIRNRYWVPKLRNYLRLFIHKCVTCARYNRAFESQLMADLPSARVHQNRPFAASGVDYAGPFSIAEKYGRKTIHRKGWIAIFVCMITRAIHIDVVVDASSAAFISCYERFICRRGMCYKLYSDNGTAFVGANKELQSAYKNWQTPEILSYMSRKGTSWIFMKPAAPHQGGIYEAAVKSTKFHLKRVLGAKHYTYEQFMTLLVQIEAILNSRPLYALYDDPKDELVLTPAHFLIGEPIIVPPPINLPKSANYSLQKLRFEQRKCLECFWKSWSNEYLTTLQQRKKWRKEKEHFKIGQIVLVKDDNLPPSKWAMGRVTKLILGKDKLVRAMEIRIGKKIYTRAVQYVVIMPIEHDDDCDSSAIEPLSVNFVGVSKITFENVITKQI